ncbi:MAG: FtsX-like permease family protein, partial [Terrimesophilobacter sp.]
ALIGLSALVQLARLLSLARRPENALLRSRGASAQWLTTAGLIEAGIVAVIGCGAGFAAAAIALLALFGPDAVAFTPWEFAALIAITVLVVFGLTGFLDSIRLAKRDAIDDSGRTQAAATIGTMVLALAAAGVAVWQSLLYGSPLTTDAAGRTSVNPLAVVAPTLTLIAIALVLLVIFGPLASAWQRIAAARPQLQPSYSARQVARGLSSYAVAVLVVTLAVGGVVVASGYSGSWHSLAGRNAELVTGADARVTLTTAGFPQANATPVTGAEFLDVPGVTAAVPVLSTPISIGDNDSGMLTAIPHDAIDKVVTNAGGSLDPSALARGVGNVKLKGIELPAGTTTLSLSMTVKEGFDIPAHVSIHYSGWVQAAVWLRDETGAIITKTLPRIDIAPLSAATSVTAPVRIDIPPGSDSWFLVAIDYMVGAEAGFINTTFGDLEATTASGTQHVALDTRTWGMPLLFSYGSSVVNVADGLTLGLQAEGGRPYSLRFAAQDIELGAISAPGYAGNWFFEPDPLPLVVSKELASHYDVKPGDTFTLRFAGSGLSINGKISAIAPLLPGVQSPNSIVVDLNALTEYVLGSSTVIPVANQIWLATSGPVSLGSVLPEGATLVTPETALDTTFAAPAELALWIAAIGCLLLAAISLGAVALTVARSRRGEIAVLRAVGISARQQSRSRFAELTAVIVSSVVFGVLGGVAVSAVTIPNLARSAVQGVPEGLSASLTFSLATGGILLLGSLVVLIGIAAFSALRVRSVALNTSERLETR